ncbi:MAG: Fe-S cluster assembly protein SufD [Crocinitomicaceae bacterium]|nr:Fe-S cluster assembly protein SufD [Crocinitomicaceae bacterium]|tara:strand:- start:4226 stop:5455 length:1230 start_codon:yes stop_codon:yes gene_type:complete
MSQTLTADKKELFLESFRVSEGISGVSKAAELALENLDFPTTRDEYWKYTRLTKILNGRFSVEPFEGSEEVVSINERALHIECINGYFQSPVGEIQEGIEITSVEEVEEALVDYQNEFFSALNTAYFTSGIKIKIKAGVEIDKSIQVNFLSVNNNIQVQPRIEIELEPNASANFIFNWHHNGQEGNFYNVVSELKLHENAQLSLHQLQAGGDENFLINTTQVNQQRDSKFAIHTISLEGKVLRNNLNIAVEGENCESILNGVYLAYGSQHFDNHTYVDHIAPNCYSSENYKGVMDDKSTAVFNGKVMVQPNAQKINAFQSNQNILLSDDATINSKPELEIYADDVQCSHGSTTGQLDEEAVFYLRSRGVSEVSAKKMMIRAFVFDVLEEIKLESFKEHVEGLVEEKFKL